jgi:hypothetical protein
VGFALRILKNSQLNRERAVEVSARIWRRARITEGTIGTYNWIGVDGDWSDVEDWVPSNGSPPAAPGSNDTANITQGGAYTVTVNLATVGTLNIGGQLNTLSIDTSLFADTFTQSGARISGAGALRVNGAATFTGVSDVETGTGQTVLKGTTTDQASGIYLDGGRVLQNAGTFNATTGFIYLGANAGAYGTPTGIATIMNVAGATFDIRSTFTIYDNGRNSPAKRANQFINQGTLEKTNSSGATINAKLNNTGTVSVTGGTLYLQGGGQSSAGKFIVKSGATLQFSGPSTTTFVSTHDTFYTVGSGAGTVVVAGGEVDFSHGLISCQFAQTGGLISGFVLVEAAATFSGADIIAGNGGVGLVGSTTDQGATIYVDGGSGLTNGSGGS